MLRNLSILTLTLLIATSAAAGRALPQDWIEDYDCRADLQTYLKDRYDKAVARQLVPYVYLYADWCRPCVAFRNRVRRDPEFARLFDGTQIIALDFDSLKKVKDKPVVLTVGAPLIIPIESDGSFGASAVDGVPWTRVVPRNIKEILCTFFASRSISGVEVDRGCQSDRKGS